jgi:hypothetical protein
MSGPMALEGMNWNPELLSFKSDEFSARGVGWSKVVG